MKSPSIGRLIDLAAQLERDERLAAERLRRRDRELGRELEAAGTEAEGRVAAWLERVRVHGEESPGEQADRMVRVVAVWLVVAGALVGTGVAGTLYFYDGSHPVNVVRVLGVFVALQLVLLLATLILCLPQSVRRMLPGLALLQDVLSVLSPGRWGGGLRRWLPAPQREAAERFAALSKRHHRLYGDVERWWWLSHSQIFAVAFHVGAIAMAFSLVAFTDLAFAWSTTLRFDATAWLQLTHALATPWAGWLPEAVPSARLVEATQYFRANEGHDPGVSAPWWPFLLACMVGYGLLPRVLLLGFARLQLRASARHAFGRLPGIAALRDRLDNALVETAAEGEEVGARMPSGAPASLEPNLAEGLRCHAIVWAALPVAEPSTLSSQLGVELSSLASAGGESLAADAAVIRALAEDGAGDPVLVLVKAWEPPVLEFLDFLGELRQALGADRGVVVVPLAIGEGGRVARPRAPDAEQWQRGVARLGDPFTQVHVPARLSA
jgi:hypothetical protein